jgi:hypothetical protein
MAFAGLLHPQVNVDFDAVKDKILRREYRPDANDQTQSLHTAEAICSQIFEVWPEPPPHNYLQVSITLPDEAERDLLPCPGFPPLRTL